MRQAFANDRLTTFSKTFLHFCTWIVCFLSMLIKKNNLNDFNLATFIYTECIAK